MSRTAGRPALFTFKEFPLRALLACAAVLVAGAGLAEDLPSLIVPVKVALKAEKWDAAVEAGEKAVKELPDSSEAYLWLGRAYGLRR